MTVHLVGAGPGDPGLITARGLELIRSCDVLVHDRLVASELVAEAPPQARVTIHSDFTPYAEAKALVDVYRQETGDDKAPGVMGGGTYARAVPNTVSIGTGWEGDGPAHENDEKVCVGHLLKMAKIYAHILYRLAQDARK